MDILFNFFAERWPEMTVIVALLAMTSLAAWKLSKYHSSMESAKDRVDNLPCEAHKDRLDDHKERFAKIESLRTVVDSTNEIVTEISKWIANRDKKMIDTFVQKRSPYRITNIGHQILDRSGGKKAIDDNLDFYIGELEALNLKTPYDVEDKSASIVFRNLSHDMFNEIKNFIYYSSDKIEMTDTDTGEKKEVEVALHAILNVMGVYLRDKYFEKHPEIETSAFFEDRNNNATQ